jgi:sulfoxide reductase heme-binding subunit YedZ
VSELPDLPPVPMRQHGPPRLRRGPAYRGLPRPVGVAAWLATAAILGAVVGATLPASLRSLGATAALAPDKLAWYGVRATGFLAYFAIAGSVIYGLLLSTRLLDAVAHRPVSLALHKDLALAGLALSALHGLLLLGDHTFAFTTAAILVPFASPYAPVAVGVGQLAFYLLAIVSGSFYVRRQIGQRTWRLIHYLTFLGFVGVTVHGIAAGSDTAAPLAIWAYLVPIATVAFFLTYRLVVSIAARRNLARIENRVVVVGR